ncbi:GAF domain-containing SpoIIE family protein phosphatase [uncultured Jatrophihabitans sp.]|uniref:GAF domain-containing SpoIIE family protein phosphatase n=1 Tax=uncultured Jatrophihabitans sp. TaxID=1610747 RepID=UPI0035CAE69D
MTATLVRAEPVAGLDRLAHITSELLDAPVVLVSVIDEHHHAVLGGDGLPPRLARHRTVPLSLSVCREVVRDGCPLVIDDVRREPRWYDHPGVLEFGIAAYAGFPLTDSQGHVIGTLCAIDHAPRRWTHRELGLLDDLARQCARDLALHELTHRPAAVGESAQDASRHSRVLLALSETLSDTLSMADVAAAVARAAETGLGCRHAGIWHRPDRNHASLHSVRDPGASWERLEELSQLPVAGAHPVAEVYRTGQAVFLPDEAAVSASRAGYPGGDPLDRSAAAVPLVVGDTTIGVLALTWPDEVRVDDDLRTTVAALALYAGQAVHRASLLDERMSAASTMQRALLTALPSPAGLELGARYRTAAANDQVGGDWYDATVLADDSVTLMIGDVMGHDIRAAAAMGQLRSMLRALGWALDDAPSVNVARLDRAAKDLQVATLASLVYARLDRPDPSTGRRRLRWTNAGHLPPLLVDRRGHCRVLGTAGPADPVLGVLPEFVRHDHEVELRQGDTVLLYTDGLIEQRGESLEDGVRRLRGALERHHARPVGELLDSVLGDVVGVSRADDVAVLAVRVA